MKRRRICYAIALGLLCALPVGIFFAMASKSYLDQLPCLQFMPNHRACGYLLALTAFAAIGTTTYFALGNLPSWLTRLERIKTPRILPLEFNKKDILKTSAVVFVLWVPTMVLLYPCATTLYDTINQLYQFFSGAPTYYSATGRIIDAEFIDHHPWFDTLLFGSFVWIGRSFGSDALGLFAYGVFQTVLTATALSASVCYLNKLNVPAPCRLIALLFVVFFPVFSASADTMQKDSLFSAFFLAYFLCFLEIFRSDGKALKSRRLLWRFITLMALCILSKKTGAIVIGLSACVMAATLNCNRLKAGLSAIATIATCAFIIPAILFPILSIAPGGSQEILGMLYQQSITVLKEDPQSVSEEDLAAINEVIDTTKALKKYTPTKTDGVKKHCRENISREALLRYLSVWAKQGLSHPMLYAKATARCCAPLLVPSTSVTFPTSIGQEAIEQYAKHADALGTSFNLDAKNPKTTQRIVKTLKSFYKNTLCAIPVISLFCSIGFYTTWIPLFAIAIALYSRKKRGVAALAPVIISALLLLVSPATIGRYALSLIYVAIPTIGWAIYCSRNADHPSQLMR